MGSTTDFVISAFNQPGTIGAILPSSDRLARAMARAAAGAPQLVELGAGTGAITAALRRQHPDVPLLAVELAPDLAQHLRQRFPGIEVRSLPAHEVLAELSPQVGAAVLVSSLPFRSLPPRLRLRSIVAIERFLVERPGRRLVQYTYLPDEPFALRRGVGLLRWRRLAAVWRNAPPAWVWELAPARMPRN